MGKKGKRGEKFFIFAPFALLALFTSLLVRLGVENFCVSVTNLLFHT